LQPYSAYADQVRRLEEQGMGPLEMSAALGGRAMQGGQFAGRLGLEGATAAATAQQKADAFSPAAAFFSGAAGAPELTGAVRKQYEDYQRNQRYKTDTPAYYDYGVRGPQ